MTPEQFYSESKWFDVRDKFERRSLIFNHYDLCEFANDYAQQELQAYRDIIKELLPLAQEVFDSITIDDGDSHRQYIQLQAMILRAKKLIDTVTPT